MRFCWSLCLILLAPALSSAATPCRPVENLSPLLAAGTVILLGEIHGTDQSPAFALELACHASQAGLPLVVALELDPAEQTRINTYLSSAGKESDQLALLAGVPWKSSYQDGRTSLAMFKLIEGVRRLPTTGAATSIVLFDAAGEGGGQQRERNMAGNLLTALQPQPAALAIVLTGNLHSRTTPGVHFNAEYEPMGYLLKHRLTGRKMVALNVAHSGGDAWTCNPSCGVHALSGNQGQPAWAVDLDQATRPPGHAGWYRVGPLTASLPAAHDPDIQLSSSAPPPGQVSPVQDGAAPRSSQEPEPAWFTPTGPLHAQELKLQGRWQAYEVDSRFKLWTFEFKGRAFTARAGEDDWYEGHIALRDSTDPAQMNFAIDNCLCGYKGMTSQAIYYWNDDEVVLAAPTPGRPRPQRFDPASGQLMRLQRITP